MLNITTQRVRKGLFRLLNGPSDLDRWDAHIAAVSKTDASPQHRQLFEHYGSKLRVAVPKATANWEGELTGWASEGRTLEQAYAEMWTTYPAGPAAQPFFVALVRRYWLECDALNKTTPKDQAVRPEQFLLDWLQADPANEKLVAVLACMPYWPLGMDVKGHWI